MLRTNVSACARLLSIALTLAAPAAHRANADEARVPVALAALTTGGVAVVDPAAGKLVKIIGGLGESTFGIAVNPVRPAQAWATDEKAGLLHEVDLSAGTATGVVVDLAPGATVRSTHQPVITADGRYVLVTVPGDETLTIVSTTTRAVTKVPMKNDPHIVDIDRFTGHVFVSRRGALRGATFLDLEKLAARFDLERGGTLTDIDIAGLEQAGAFLAIPISGAPRVITALGASRFALAMYGKRGPLVYEVSGGKARLVDDLDNVIATRPREPKGNLEYLEAQAVSRDGRTLVGTDQGIPSCLRVWELDASGRALAERCAIPLAAEPYWVNVAPSGATAWVTVPKFKDASGAERPGQVLTVDVASGRVTSTVQITGTDGRLHSPKRMVVEALPASFLSTMTGGVR